MGSQENGGFVAGEPIDDRGVPGRVIRLERDGSSSATMSSTWRKSPGDGMVRFRT